MKAILVENRWFYLGFLILLFIGLVVFFNQEKGDLVLYFARWRDPFVDSIFTFTTKIGEAYIYVISILLLLFVRYRYSLLVPFVGFFVLIVSLSLKALFATPRPRTYFYKLFDSNEITGVADLYLNVGYNSFPSGHSMSGFAIFTFLALSLRAKSLGPILLLIASLVAFSRVVITQHFLEDILAGSAIGLIIGTLIYWVQSSKLQEPHLWFNKNLLDRKDKTIV